MLQKLLVYDPQKRITVEKALKHPYLQEFSNSSDEISYIGEINLELNDDKNYEINRYRDILYGRISKI